MIAITPHALRDALVTRTRKVIAEMRLPGAVGDDVVRHYDREITVYARDLPVPDKLDGDYFPCIIVSNGGVNQTDFYATFPQRTISIDFFFGIFDPDEDFPGMDDAMGIAEKLYQDLMALPEEGGCTLTTPISYQQIAGSEKNPYFYALLTTKWLAPAMQITSELI